MKLYYAKWNTRKRVSFKLGAQATRLGKIVKGICKEVASVRAAPTVDSKEESSRGSVIAHVAQNNEANTHSRSAVCRRVVKSVRG